MTIRAPHFSKRVSRKVQQPQAVANLLVTTLAVVAATPFVSNEQTIPHRQIVQQPLQVGSPLVLLSAVEERPFFQTDWPNPVTVDRQQPNNVGAFLPLTIVAEFRFFENDLSRPVFPIAQQPENRGNLLPLTAEADNPFAPNIFANPFVVPTSQDTNQTGSSLALIETSGEKPFAQTEWLNPLVLDRQKSEISGNNLLPTPVAVGDPFFQTDWHVQFVVPIQEPVNAPAFLPLIVKPFVQTDWPNPHSIGVQQPFSVGTFLPLTVEPEKPFAQTDWPNPLIEPIQTPDYSGAFLALVVEPEKPFAQTEWPNPTLSVLVQTPYQVGSPLGLIEFAGEKPFLQGDWPNPTVDVLVQVPFQIGNRFLLPAVPVVSIPNSIQQILVSLLNSEQTLTVAATNSEQTLLAGNNSETTING